MNQSLNQSGDPDKKDVNTMPYEEQQTENLQTSEAFNEPIPEDDELGDDTLEEEADLDEEEIEDESFEEDDEIDEVETIEEDEIETEKQPGYSAPFKLNDDDELESDEGAKNYL